VQTSHLFFHRALLWVGWRPVMELLMILLQRSLSSNIVPGRGFVRGLKEGLPFSGQLKRDEGIQWELRLYIGK